MKTKLAVLATIAAIGLSHGATAATTHSHATAAKPAIHVADETKTDAAVTADTKPAAAAAEVKTKEDAVVTPKKHHHKKKKHAKAEVKTEAQAETQTDAEKASPATQDETKPAAH